MQATIETQRGVITFLMDLLDEIDTASDVAKGNEKLYRNLVDKIQKRRWETGIDTDGYTYQFDVMRVPAKSGKVFEVV